MLYNIICFDKLTGEVTHTFNPQPLSKCRKDVQNFIRLNAQSGNFGRYDYVIESETIPVSETLRFIRNISRPQKHKNKHRRDILLTILSGSLFGLFVTIGILSTI